MKIIILFLSFSLFLSSCYLFDPNVEVQFINDTEITINSISWKSSVDEEFSDDLLVSDLEPGETFTFIFPPGLYVFRFGSDSVSFFNSEEINLIGHDITSPTANAGYDLFELSIESISE